MKPLFARSAPRLVVLGCVMITSAAFGQPHGGPHFGGGFGHDGGPPPGGPRMGRGMGPGMGGGPGHGHGPGRLIHELLDPCGAACASQARECRHGSDDGIKACAEASCSAAILAAREACPAGERPAAASGCRASMHDLMDCLDPCIETQRPVLDACRDQEDACRRACGESTDSQ